MMRDELFKALRSYDPELANLSDEDLTPMVDQLLDFVDFAGYSLISKDLREQLTFDSNLLSSLENHGVDSWEGWADALRAVES